MADNSLRVWSVGVAASPDLLGHLNSLLSVDELTRSRAFRFDRDRTAFIVARGILRLLLARHTGIPARTVRFCYGPNGKPSLSPEQGASGIHFNVSHSGGLVAYALSTVGPVGVDIEAVRSLDDTPGIAQRFFAPAEYEELMSVDPSQFVRAFLTAWTRKEAYVKATGEGLSQDPRRVRVSLTPGVSRVWVEGSDNSEESAWHVHDVNPRVSHVGAVAIRDQNAAVVSRHCDSSRELVEDLT